MAKNTVIRLNSKWRLKQLITCLIYTPHISLIRFSIFILIKQFGGWFSCSFISSVVSFYGDIAAFSYKLPGSLSSWLNSRWRLYNLIIYSFQQFISITNAEINETFFFQGRLHLIWATGQTQDEFYKNDQLKYHGRQQRGIYVIGENFDF